MANILMNNIEGEVIDPYEPGADIITELRKHYREKLTKRKKYERTYWEDPPDDLIDKLKENPDNFNMYQQ